jgi:hypothetical protein
MLDQLNLDEPALEDLEDIDGEVSEEVTPEGETN